MNNLAIIPARSGSKGVKDKNIKLLNGLPLMGYSIKAAIDSKMYSHVMVSTDSQEYAMVAEKCGAEVPFLRSDALAQDKSSSWDAVKEVIQKYLELGIEFDTVTLLQPTSPLRDANDIQNAFKIFKEKEANSVVSVCVVEHSPLWSNVLDKDYSMVHFAESIKMNANRQMLPTYYRLNGAIYLVKISVLNDIGNLYANHCYAYVMTQKKSVDIDSMDDFEYAEYLFNKKQFDCE